MEREEEKVWIVLEHRPDGSVGTSVFDNEADANNFCIEMQARTNDQRAVHVEESILIRRGDMEMIDSDDRPWGSVRVDANSEFIEGLMEEMVPIDQIRPGAAERFACEKIDMVRKRAQGRFDQIVKEEMEEALKTCMDDWCGHADMEY